MNRIDHLIQANIDNDAREDALAAFAGSVASGDEAPPGVDEVLSAMRWLAHATSGFAQYHLWRLLSSGPVSGDSLAFARQWLAQPGFAHRDKAVDYLGRAQPELIPQVVAQWAGDPDPGVRYAIAQHLLDSDPDRAVDLLIDALATDDHEVFDAATMDICSHGKTVHLDRLRQLDAAAGGDSGYGRVAEALRATLEGDD